MFNGAFMKPKSAGVFRTIRSRTARLTKELRSNGDNVVEENVMILEPALNWPDGYVNSFAGVPDDFSRAAQGAIEKREKLR
jgi:virulence-associated protein VagC